MDGSREIVIETKTGFVKAYEMQIVSIKTKDRRSEVLLSSGQSIECIWPIKKWKEVLNEKRFIESHRGIIVNLEHVSGVEDETILLLDGAVEEYLSRRKFQRFKQAYLTYTEGKE